MFLILFLSLSNIWAANDLSWVRFEKPFDCDANYIAVQKCIVSKTKEFSDSEKILVLDRLRKLQAEFPKFFAKITEKNDSVLFYRHSNATTRISSRTFKANHQIVAWVSHGKSYVHITDKYFNEHFQLNGKFDSLDYFLIHELSHIVDHSFKVSKNEEFLKLYSWEKVETTKVNSIGGHDLVSKRWQSSGIPYQEVDMLRSEVLTLLDSGQKTQATELSLSFGQSHGHPGSYSMTNPAENFAEIVVGYFLDPESLRTAPTAVHSWLENFFN